MNREQAVAMSIEGCAYRVVGSLRVIVAVETQTLKITIQRRAGKCWIIDDDGGGIRYLTGVLRSASGIYHVAGDTLSILDEVMPILPENYQHLFIPECNDWLPLC